MVGIAVVKLDTSLLVDKVDGRDRKDIVILTGGLVEINSVVGVHCTGLFIDFKGQSESLGGFGGAVGEQRVTELVFGRGLLEAGGPVRADREDAVAEIRQIIFNAGEGREVPVTVGAPASAIKDENARLPGGQAGKVPGLPPDGLHRHRRDGFAEAEGGDVLRFPGKRAKHAGGKETGEDRGYWFHGNRSFRDGKYSAGR